MLLLRVILSQYLLLRIGGNNQTNPHISLLIRKISCENLCIKQFIKQFVKQILCTTFEKVTIMLLFNTIDLEKQKKKRKTIKYLIKHE